ncbi:hypothetical protein GCM10010302_15470 [Streptomyces polychromogenes]|uniref:Uncharacterized protein n=1 Tax=Streptomyces polychromogenes TaxID=67342 RepID=A0ABP3EW44_9ACTN
MPPVNEGSVKACAYHATVDVALAPPCAGVASCWADRTDGKIIDDGSQVNGGHRDGDALPALE